MTKKATAVERNRSAFYLMRTMRRMIKEAAAKREILNRSKVKAGERCVGQAFQKHGVRFRRTRSKPVLTKDDVKARFRFARKYRSISIRTLEQSQSLRQRDQFSRVAPQLAVPSAIKGLRRPPLPLNSWPQGAMPRATVRGLLCDNYVTTTRQLCDNYVTTM